MLKDKNAIITGACGGIGRATVRSFAEKGANIWACDLKPDSDVEKEFNRLEQEFHVKIQCLYFDLSDANQVKELVRQIKADKTQIDILVNVAGISGKPESFQMTSLETMQRMFSVNFFSATLLMQYVSRIMMKQKFGSIVNLTSISAVDATSAQYEYSASKAALIGATKNLAFALAPYNIRVNAVAPGVIDTPMTRAMDSAYTDTLLEKVLLKRMGKPEEIANVIAFLASDCASYMTGQVIRVDGGM